MPLLSYCKFLRTWSGDLFLVGGGEGAPGKCQAALGQKIYMPLQGPEEFAIYACQDARQATCLQHGGWEWLD